MLPLYEQTMNSSAPTPYLCAIYTKKFFYKPKLCAFCVLTFAPEYDILYTSQGHTPREREENQMTTITLTTIERTYTNNGQHAEQTLAYALTGEIRAHDNVPFDKGSDIPEYHMSVKSSKASLMSGNRCESQTKEGIIAEFIAKSASTCFAYVVADFTVAYVMNGNEFAEFCHEFGSLTRESTKNGGKAKVQLRAESAKTLAWFKAHI